MSGATIEISTRAFAAAEVLPASVDVAARTVEVIFSTGAAVKRWSWDEGMYLETLDMAASSVDLGRLNGGASFLDSHDQSGMASRIGAVVPGSARIEAGRGLCTVKLSTARNGQQILDDLAQGLPLPISVGYRVHQYEKTEGSGDALPTYRATSWEPLEISAVPVPADAGAHARADEAQRHAVPIHNAGAPGLENRTMTTTPAAEADTLERARADKITAIAERHDVPMRLVRKALADGTSEAQFRELVLEDMRKRQDKDAIFSIAPQHGEVNERRLDERLADAMSARISRGFEIKQDVRAFVNLSVPELARRALEARGTGTAGMSSNQLVERALHTTSDFPMALNTVGQRELARAYAATPSALKAIAKGTTARDFRPKASIILQGGGTLLKVNEAGEFKRTTFVEGGEQYGLSTFGRIFGITRQALVNDDLGIFADMPGRFGRAATEFEASFLTAVLEANGRMADGQPVFHTSHRNLAATGSALSIDSLSAGRLALRQQTDAAGDLIGIAPKYLIVPSTLETLAEQLLATIAATKSSDVNPFASQLTLVVEPRLKGNAWYLAGDPALYPSLEYAHLEGEEGPRQDQRIGFDIDGVEFKVALDFGAAITDYRGLYKNPGIAP